MLFQVSQYIQKSAIAKQNICFSFRNRGLQIVFAPSARAVSEMSAYHRVPVPQALSAGQGTSVRYRLTLLNGRVKMEELKLICPFFLLILIAQIFPGAPHEFTAQTATKWQTRTARWPETQEVCVLS
jgi:hypothetical protein